ncbi:MAG: hypothetical protein Q4C34_06745 [Bacteroidales bacterium]|nr:hypothetical protein [Bacteroidales bacterium]
MKYRQLTIILATICICVSSLAAQDFSPPDPGKWYQLVTRYNGTDARKGRCIQYCAPGTDHAGLLWSAVPLHEGDAGLDCQLWRFIPSPDTPARYALVCKAAQSGFVDPTPTGSGSQARWHYVTDSDGSIDPYGFLFVTTGSMSGVEDTGESYCAIASDKTIDSYYNVMNCASAGQGYAINLWNEDYSEDANEWLFRFVEKAMVVTGITDPVAPVVDGTSVWYDLSGRRVSAHPAPGVYIVDGRKVFVR